MNRPQSLVFTVGLVLATLVVFLPRQLSFASEQDGQSYYLHLGVPLLTQIFLLSVVAAITALAVWSARHKTTQPTAPDSRAHNEITRLR